jgi:histidine triad (HIT) family protein
MATIFSRIIQGELPCEKIEETEDEICFLDISPLTEGHTLVVPKREVARFEELSKQELLSLMLTIQRVAKAVCKAYGNSDYNIQLNNGPDAGQEVSHVHFHIIPRPGGLRVPKLGKYADGQMSEVSARIRACLDS